MALRTNPCYFRVEDKKRPAGDRVLVGLKVYGLGGGREEAMEGGAGIYEDTCSLYEI